MLRAPHFWSAGLDPQSRASAPMTRMLLTPFAAAYAGVTARRIAKTTPLKLTVPVICVGNLTSGGSGKTPIVDAIRARLIQRSIHAASLSRGYGGTLKGPVKVDANIHTAGQVGDEPLMLSANGDSWISRDRPQGGRAMISAGVDAIIMDDGHQNPSLAKDLSLIVIDSHAPFGNGYVLPKGPLREPPKVGLARANAIILIGDGPVPPIVKTSGAPTLRADLVQTAPPPEGPLFAFAGIGRPARFFDHLRNSGADVRDQFGFPDHHTYTPRDLARLRALAAAHDYQLVTTRKDYVRLSPDMREGITTIDVRAVFTDEDALDALLLPLFEGGHCG
jgi:tetraacyldisaccharide 4'-kinase